MSRKKLKSEFSREVLDVKYGSLLVAKLVNQVMVDGKKSLATSIVYSAMDYLAEKTGLVAIEALESSINNVKSPVGVRSRRVGGATYQVPVDIPVKRQQTLALRWIVAFARNRKEHSMQEKLGKEFLDAFNNVGSSIKKRVDTVKMAEANRAFAHYKW